MTSFKINSDDQAVRGLQKDNKTPVISGPVLPVKASNPVEKSPENMPLRNSTSDNKQTNLSHYQRRQQDRRKSSQTVLFNTRSKHDRRLNNNEDESEHHLHGIDKLV